MRIFPEQRCQMNQTQRYLSAINLIKFHPSANINDLQTPFPSKKQNQTNSGNPWLKKETAKNNSWDLGSLIMIICDYEEEKKRRYDSSSIRRPQWWNGSPERMIHGEYPDESNGRKVIKIVAIFTDICVLKHAMFD